MINGIFYYNFRQNAAVVSRKTMTFGEWVLTNCTTAIHAHFPITEKMTHHETGFDKVAFTIHYRIDFNRGRTIHMYRCRGRKVAGAYLVLAGDVWVDRISIGTLPSN
jgi:hypothetical protein